MVTTSARLLRLLTLLQVRREWPGAELASRLDITTRTLRRDVDRLRRLGYPVQATPGTTGGYRLGAGANLPPLLLDDDEAVAVAVSLRTAAGGTVAGIEETSLAALAKLEQVLPVRLRQRVETVQAATVPLLTAAPTVDPDILTVIAGACRGYERLRFRYRGADAALTERCTEPHRLVHTGLRWYLVARDVDRGDWRTFRVDRIDRPRLTGGRFAPPQDAPDAAGFVARALSTGPYRYRARVRLFAPAAEVAARMPRTVGVVEADGPDRCVLITGSDSLDAIAVHLALLDTDFAVLEPPELAARVGALGRRLCRAADQAADQAAEQAADH